MSTSAQPTYQEVVELAEAWFSKFDAHVSVVELLPMLAEDGLQISFPDGTFRGQEGFDTWYQISLRKFFDETHTLKSVTLSSTDGSQVKIVVNWQARFWNPPAAKSVWIGFDAYQTWIVTRSEKTGKVVILTYIVDELRPMPGSATL